MLGPLHDFSHFDFHSGTINYTLILPILLMKEMMVVNHEFWIYSDPLTSSSEIIIFYFSQLFSTFIL